MGGATAIGAVIFEMHTMMMAPPPAAAAPIPTRQADQALAPCLSPTQTPPMTASHLSKYPCFLIGQGGSHQLCHNLGLQLPFLLSAKMGENYLLPMVNMVITIYL